MMGFCPSRSDYAECAYVLLHAFPLLVSNSILRWGIYHASVKLFLVHKIDEHENGDASRDNQFRRLQR